MNRLRDEKSPYLLQHAANPVDWYPWGDEAFSRARSEDKPVFLSIGYSTCHWCHVMAHESFEDRDIAQAMNEAFVNIKVDREERPDIDSLYMRVCQGLTGRGGWPLTVVMTPDKKPFFAGTYFPRETRHGHIGMRDLIKRLDDIWRHRRREIEKSAGEISAWLTQPLPEYQGRLPDEDTLHAAFKELNDSYDPDNGGFHGAPKFPPYHHIMFLLRYAARTGNETARDMAAHTLAAMRRGGMFDQVGFGFHRYATDARWILPHFEKMLYDQAMLALAYLEGYQALSDSVHARTAREIFTYVSHELTSPEGGFYCAEDADSEGKEGRFYVWTEDELLGILGKDEAGLFQAAYGTGARGNFNEEATGERTGSNVLYRARTLSELAAIFGEEQAAILKRLESSREKILHARNGRIRPQRDEKILTDWNGLMIAAFARGGRVLRSDKYTDAARRAADFILQNMRGPGGGLLHRWYAGRADIPGFLDDYAFPIWGLIELYEAGFDAGYLKEALALANYAIEHFWDETGGAFFSTSADHEELFGRAKDLQDRALPSGNAVMALYLARLGRMTGQPDLEEKAYTIGKSFAQAIGRMPSAFTQYLSALDFLLGPSTELVITGLPGSPDTHAMLDALRTPFMPRNTVIFIPGDHETSAMSDMAPFTSGMHSLEGRATAYICQGKTCTQPIVDIERLKDALGLDPG